MEPINATKKFYSLIIYLLNQNYFSVYLLLLVDLFAFDNRKKVKQL